MSLNENTSNNFVQIKSFQTSPNGSSKYVISAEKFAEFEANLFDLLGIQSTPFKVDTTNQSAVNYDTDRSKIVSDMSVFEKNLELNAFSGVQLKKIVKTEAEKAKNLVKSSLLSDDSATNTNIEFRSKVITVILNRPNRPRPAGRLLLTKKNSATIDSVLNEIGNMFKANAAQIRKLFNLRGTQVSQVISSLH